MHFCLLISLGHLTSLVINICPRYIGFLVLEKLLLILWILLVPDEPRQLSMMMVAYLLSLTWKQADLRGMGPPPINTTWGKKFVLLKIELDPRVRSVFQHNLLPHFALDLVPDPKRKGIDTDYNVHFSQESNRETDKADGFVDDNSIATEATLGSLQALKDICIEFSSFSDLQSNAEKTTLLKIGTAANLTEEILQLGFNVVEKVKLLGMDIDHNLSSLTNFFDDASIRITQMIEHWESFYLSLPLCYHR